MSDEVFPAVRGLAFPVRRTPTWDTEIQQASSGKEVRIAYQVDPIWKWELSFNYLKDNPNDLMPLADDTDLVQIQGFYMQMKGRWDTFLYDDVDPGVQPGTGRWDSVQGQAIATGDGTEDRFQLIRTSNGYSEPIQSPYTDPPPQVYIDGLPQTYSTEYTVTDKGVIVFTTPPALGEDITADFSYYWRVRFDDDAMDFENFMYQLWELKKVRLVQVKV